MRRILLLAFVLCSSSAQAASLTGSVAGKPFLSSAQARAMFGDSPLATWLQVSEALRAEASGPLMFLYPGKRDVFDNIPPGDFDITRIDVDVHLDLDNVGQIEVEAVVRLVPLVDDLDKLSFSLEVPELDEVTWDGGSVVADKGGDTLSLEFDGPLPLEQEVVLRFRYHGAMDCSVKFMLPTCKLEAGWMYVTHSGFLPQVFDYFEVFTGTMRIIISGKGHENWNAGGTGTYVQMLSDPAAGTRTVVFEHIFPTSLFAFSAAPMVRVSGMAGETPVAAVGPGGLAGKMPSILGIAQDVLAYFSDVFVSYPWNKLDVVAMPNSFGGGFGPLSTVFVVKSTFDIDPQGNSYYGAMQLLSHEIAHEWWGNLVEMGDMGSILLSEGLAEFSSNRFFEVAAGSRWPAVSNNMSYTYTVDHDEEPLLVSPYVYASPYYYQVAYQKGSAVIDMLRIEIGEEALLAALDSLTTKWFMKYATIADLEAELEAAAGRDLDYYFKQWFEGRGILRADVSADCSSTSPSCRVRISQITGPTGQDSFKLSLPVYVDQAGLPGQNLTIQVDGWVTEVELPVDPARVRRILLDPYRQILRIWRPQLQGDIDLNGVVDGADIVEMSFAFQTNIVLAGDWGGDYFVPNYSYNELADVRQKNGDPGLDGRVTQTDLDALLENFGAVGIGQPATP
ncbi:MAG: hypothetical protein FJ109_13710 [Deltaproteobacteria bacterium]|nr:hypothetical protein [Deltaproteobacteria bacterium]